MGPYIEFHLVRLMPDGTRDLSFGKRGVVIFPVPWAIGVPNDVVMDAQGRMYVTTHIERNNGFTLDIGVFRIRADGTLDKTFGNNGLAFANVDRADEPNAIRLDPDGKIVVAGSTYNDNEFPVAHHVVVARFTTTGQLDSTFSGDGKVETPFSGDAEAWSVGFDASGRVLVDPRRRARGPERRRRGRTGTRTPACWTGASARTGSRRCRSPTTRSPRPGAWPPWEATSW